jgi:hypothetical protein
MDPHLLGVRIFESWWCNCVYFEIVSVPISRVEQAIKVELHQAFAQHWGMHQSEIKVPLHYRLEEVNMLKDVPVEDSDLSSNKELG